MSRKRKNRPTRREMDLDCEEAAEADPQAVQSVVEAAPVSHDMVAAAPDDGWQPGHTSWSPSRPGVLDLLQDSPMIKSATLPWGSNETFLVLLDGGSAGQSYAVYKPQLGEVPLWDFPDGTLYRREYASYLVSDVLGWGIVPPTVVRDGPYGVGAVQLFIESERRASHRSVRDSTLATIRRIAAFDLLVNNTDRKGEHFLMGADGRLWGIDHGLTFHRQPKLRTVIWDFADEPIPAALLDDLEALREHLCAPAALRSGLDDLLAPAEVGALCRRLEAILSGGTYPRPSSQRSVPWSMW